jgi:hypothetical protein
MSDNEDAAPSLGYSEKLSVENSVGDPIPEFDQHPVDKRKGVVKGKKRRGVVLSNSVEPVVWRPELHASPLC